jgi:hypothetical protein
MLLNDKKLFILKYLNNREMESKEEEKKAEGTAKVITD